MSPIVIALSIVGVLELISLWFILRWTFTEPSSITMSHVDFRKTFGDQRLTIIGDVVYEDTNTYDGHQPIGITEVPATLENVEKFFNEPSTSSYLGEIKR